jgi:hypothetical protein
MPEITPKGVAGPAFFTTPLLKSLGNPRKGGIEEPLFPKLGARNLKMFTGVKD